MDDMKFGSLAVESGAFPDAGFGDSTSGLGFSATPAQLAQGFTVGDHTHEPYPWYGPGAYATGTDDDGTTYVGDARERGGFLTRPEGEER